MEWTNSTHQWNQSDTLWSRWYMMSAACKLDLVTSKGGLGSTEFAARSSKWSAASAMQKGSWPHEGWNKEPPKLVIGEKNCCMQTCWLDGLGMRRHNFCILDPVIGRLRVDGPFFIHDCDQSGHLTKWNSKFCCWCVKGQRTRKAETKKHSKKNILIGTHDVSMWRRLSNLIKCIHHEQKSLSFNTKRRLLAMSQNTESPGKQLLASRGVAGQRNLRLTCRF